MRLIDAESLIDELENDRPLNWTDSSGEIQEQMDWGGFIGMVNVAPTIDAVPVVRCRECKHCDPENYHCDHPMSTAAPLRRKPDDFCSYGERKEG